MTFDDEVTNVFTKSSCGAWNGTEAFREMCNLRYCQDCVIKKCIENTFYLASKYRIEIKSGTFLLLGDEKRK